MATSHEAATPQSARSESYWTDPTCGWAALAASYGDRRGLRASAIWIVLRAAPLRRLSPLREEVEAILQDVVATESTDECRVLTGGKQRRRHVGNHDARRVG